MSDVVLVQHKETGAKFTIDRSQVTGAVKVLGDSSAYVAPESLVDEPGTKPRYPDGAPALEWTADQLRAYAEDHDKDVKGANTKADLLAAIQTPSGDSPEGN